MNEQRLKAIRRNRRKRGLRKRILGTAERPRLTVYRSGMNIYAQIVDDGEGRTIVQASSIDKALRATIGPGGNVAAAAKVGEALAERAMAKGVTTIAFDRNGYKYHGRIKSLAEALRKAGLKF